MRDENRYLVLYLAIVFGIWWLGILFLTAYKNFLTPLIGNLSFTHPIVIFFTYLPSLTGLVIYFLCGGTTALRGILAKLIPRKKDLFIFPLLFGVAVLFVVFMRFGSILLGIEVPTITYTIPQMISTALWNFIKETALIGGCFGWVGFLLPFIQGKLKNNVLSGLLTGLIFGLWVLPMPFLLGLKINISYWLYLIQLMTFFVFISYIFNFTRGTLTFYLFMFWLIATGSHIQMYYFNTEIQLMQIIFFMLVSIVTYFIVKKAKLDVALQTFPDFIK